MPITFTTTLPDEDQPILGNGVEDEVAVDRETATTNNGSVRIQIRETGTSTWDANAEGFGEFVGAFDTLTMEFVGREDGEEYEVRVRTETEHVIGAWTAPVSIVTKFPGATGLGADSSTSSSITISWTDNADNESGTRVYRRDELDPRRDTGFGDWTVVADIAPDTGDGNIVEYVDEDVEPNHDYEYYVEPYTDYKSAESSKASTTTAVAVPGEGWFIVLERPDGEKATVPHHAFDSERATIEPATSAVARWSFDTVPNDILRNWLRSEAFIYYDGTLWVRGPFTRYHPEGGSGEAAAKMEGLGAFERLKAGGYTFGVNSEPGHEAFERFVNENLTDWVVDVTPPGQNTVDENYTVQQETTATDLENLFADAIGAADRPFAVDSSADEVHPTPTADVSEATNTDYESGVGFSNGDKYVGGQALLWSSSGDAVEWNVMFDHDVPESRVGVAVRDEIVSDSDITFTFNGDAVDELGGTGKSLGWEDVGDGRYGGDGYQGGDLSAETTYTLRIDANATSEYLVDAVCVFDRAYYPSVRDWGDEGWETLHEAGGHLDGPHTYRPVEVVASAYSQSYNITAADVNVVMNDVSNEQRLQSSNDGGDNWFPLDGTETNTSVSTADFSAAGTYGTDIQGRTRLGGYEPNGARDATPRLRYDEQRLSEWEVRIDTNALRVIDDQTYTGSPYDILNAIAGDSGIVFVPDYRKDQLAMEAFVPGDVVRDVAWTIESADPVDTTEGYFNKVTVFGPEQDDGTRLSATAEARTEIDEVGEVPGPAEFRPDATTEAELSSIARTRLGEGVSKDTITGSIDISGQFVQPGYAYRVDAFEAIDDRTDPAYVLQSASFNWGTMSLDFEGRNSLARAIRSIETEVQTTKRAV